MNFPFGKLRPLGLCIGIVITMIVAWWLAGGSGRVGEGKVTSLGHDFRPLSDASKVPSPEVKPAAFAKEKKASLGGAKVPVTPVQLSPFQEQLVRRSSLLDRRRFAAVGSEPARELRLWRTSFKYPLVREETWLAQDAQGQEVVVRREFSVADHAMVRFPEAFSAIEIKAWAQRRGFHLRHALRAVPIWLVSSQEANLGTAEKIIAAFQQDFPDAKSAIAERDYLLFPSLMPNDSSVGLLWGMNNTGQTGGVVDADIDAPEAWDLATGSRQVLVGVIDTGIDRGHPDLAANLWQNPREIPGNRVDDDGNGFVDDTHGWDFFSDDNDPSDENNHGTHCAGTIGGVGNNQSGVVGVCWQVSMVGIRFLGPNGGTTSDAVDSIHYARQLQVNLTSNSWGGGGYSALLQSAIQQAETAGQLFVTAAGNDGLNSDLTPNYPSGYPVGNIIAVAASTDRDTRASFSNYGATTVDLAAPGDDIYSTIRSSGYASFNGTSMATPHVAGAAALLLSVAPDLSVADLKSKLMTSVDRLPAFATTTVSGGRLNLARLIQEAAGPRPLVQVIQVSEAEAGGNGDGVLNPGETLDLFFQVTNRGSEVAQNVSVTIRPVLAGSAFTVLRGDLPVGTIASGTSFVSPTSFQVRSAANSLTPLAEELEIVVRYGSPLQVLTQRYSLYLLTSSFVQGRVFDTAKGTPLEGAVVRFSGPSTRTARTDSDGRYRVLLTDGNYQANALSAGYLTSAAVAVNVPPSRTELNFSLGVPQLTITPNHLEETLYSGRKSTRRVELRNQGSAPLTWSLRFTRQPTTEGQITSFTLPEREIDPDQFNADTGVRSFFNSSRVETLAALDAPLVSLKGVKVGMVASTWERNVFSEDLRARGAQILTVSSPLTAIALSELDVLIVDDAIRDLSTDDLNQIRARVTGGMGLLCEADDSASMSSINQLFQGTGITAFSDGFRDVTFTDIRPHPMTAGVGTLVQYSVGAYAVTSQLPETLVGAGVNRAHAALTRLGSGLMLFIGNEITDEANFVTGDGRLFANQIVDGLAAEPGWIKASPALGSLLPGGTQQVDVSLDSALLSAGEHEAFGAFLTNIPDEGGQVLPVSLKVVEAPQISFSPSNVNFESVVQGVPAVRQLTITNRGPVPLEVNRIELVGEGAEYFQVQPATAFALPTLASQTLSIALASNAPFKQVRAELRLFSNDPTGSPIAVQILGQRQLPPDLQLSPENIGFVLREMQKGVASLTLRNRGKGPLHWNASLADNAGRPPAWAQLSEVSGTDFPGSNRQIRIWLDSAKLSVGEHTCTFTLTSNDADRPSWSVPVSLRVQPIPILQMQTVHDAGEVRMGQSKRFEVYLHNLGSAPLVLSSALVLSSSFRCVSGIPMTIPARSGMALNFEFHPRSTAGRHQALAAFLTNAPSGPIRFRLTGTAKIGPRLALSPSALSLNLPAGTEQVRWVRVTNTGDEPMSWSFQSEDKVDWLKLDGEPSILQPGKFNLVGLRMNTHLLEPGIKTTTLAFKKENEGMDTSMQVRLSITRSASLAVTPRTIHISRAWAGHVEASSFVCENLGNQPLTILSLRASHPRLSVSGASLALPRVLQPGERLEVPFQFTIDKVGQYADAFFITSSLAPNRPVRLPVTSQVLAPPVLRVTPSELDMTVEPGAESSADLGIENVGGDVLTWKGRVSQGTGPAADLSNLLNRVESSPSTLTGLLSNSRAFTGGTTGSSIEDGGDNRYDTGNIISTDLFPERRLDYSDGVLAQHSLFGARGRYFTLKTGPLWMCAADLDGVSRFVISGGLGADGAGRVGGGQITRTVAGVTYRGFYKRVAGASVPSVNHLIIVQQQDGLQQRYDENNTNSDFHEVSGLAGSVRLYYLMFGLSSGLAYSEQSFGVLMETFLREMVHAESPDWLTMSLMEGQATAGQMSRSKLTLSPAQLLPGIYTAAVHLETNSPSTSAARVPVTLRVPSRVRLQIKPDQLHFPDTFLGSTSQFVCTLSNPGNQALEIAELFSNSPAYQISDWQSPAVISRGGKASFQLVFKPDGVGAFPAELVLRSNSHQQPELRLPLSGRCLRGPALQLDPMEITAVVEPGSSSIVPLNLSNTGDALLAWSAQPSMSLVGQVAIAPASGTALSGASQNLSLGILTMATSSPGLTQGSIRFTSNDTARRVYDLPVRFTVNSRPRGALSRTDLVFGQVMVGASASSTVQIRNTGNATLRVSAVRNDSLAFSIEGVSFPRDIPVGGSLTLPFRFSPMEVTASKAEFRFALDSPALPSELLLRVTGEGVAPPILNVQPATEIDFTLKQGQTQVVPLSVKNEGGSLLIWQAQVKDRSIPSGALSEVLQRVDDTSQELGELIPDRFLFQDGVTGTSILDGGDDMYDSGNYLSTNLGRSIPYSDGSITTSSQIGAGGNYFTRKRDGWFLFVADFGSQVTEFSITGNLGADGEGSVDAAVMDRSYHGRDYVGYFKSVHSASGDASVNHLIITERRPGLYRTHSPNSDLDDHALYGLSGGRVYYLLFSRDSGLPVDDALARQIMDFFLERIALVPVQSWVSVSPTSGSVFRSASSPVNVTLQTQALPVGLHTAKVEFSGNAPGAAAIEIPLKLTVLEPDLSVSPQRFEWSQMHQATSQPSRLSITARPGLSPSWTAMSNVNWLSLSRTRGIGSAEIDLTSDSTLQPGSYSAKVTVVSDVDGTSITIPVTVMVHATAYTQFFTDYRQPSRILGLVRGQLGQPSLLVGLDSGTLAASRPLTLPPDITDADLTTEGSRLYAISFAEKTITEVDLDSWQITRSQTLPLTLDAGSADPYHYDVEAGRPGIVYYTDALAQPELHVFDFENGHDLSRFKLNNGAGVADFNVSPDGNFMHVISQSSWSGAGTASVARINSSGTTLVQTHLANQAIPAVPIRAGIFLSASRDAFYTRAYRHTPLLDSRQDYSRAASIVAASAYGHALVFSDALVESVAGTTLASLPSGIQAAAFSATQNALIYQHPIQQRPIRVPLAGIINLPAVSIRPAIPNAGSVSLNQTALSWSGLPTAASYDVYLGTDAELVQKAGILTSGIYRLNTTGVSYTLPQETLQLGMTYYWRIDAKAPDGSAQRGEVWSFTVAPIHGTLVNSTAACFPGGTVQNTLNLTTAESATSWTLSETAPWLSLSQSSGSGSRQVGLTYTAGSLARGTYTTQLTLRSGSHQIDIPLTLRVLGSLNLVKMVPDPSLPVIYGLHTEFQTSESFMLWIHPATAAIQHVVPVSWEVRDFIVQAHDDRLYLLRSNGANVAVLQRQQDRAITSQWATGLTATQIFNAPIGRLLLLTSAGSLRLYHSTLGGQVGAARSVPIGSTVVGSSDGRFVLTASSLGLSSSLLTRFDLNSTAISTAMSATVLTPFSNVLIVSGDGNRAFYAGLPYDATSLSSLGNRITAAPILGTSWTGHVVWSANQAIDSSTGTVLSTYASDAQLLTSTPNQTHLLRYQSSTNSLVSQPVPSPAP